MPDVEHIYRMTSTELEDLCRSDNGAFWQRERRQSPGMSGIIICEGQLEASTTEGL